jgi:biotin carboxyl carrier protein
MEKLLAPMAGNIWKIECKEGDSVNDDDVLIIMEAMKMEAEVYSPATGVIAKITVKEGQDVEEGQILLEINV